MLRVYRDDLYALAGRPELFTLLAARAASTPALTPNVWRDAVIDTLVFADNPWTRDAEQRGTAACEGWLAEAARADLDELQHLALEDVPGIGPAWGAGTVPEVARALAGAACWSECLPLLAQHHRQNGSGDFARYGAFRWGDGRLQPVTHPDLVLAAELVGYESQRAAVAANTERFLDGLPAQDVLIYGDRGTGKSSTVKALLTAYQARGLRLIAVDRHAFRDFAAVAGFVRGRRQRFILFFDDLSFEGEETEYKDLKTLLEGGVEARPVNLLVYATSNRRHVVREEIVESDRPHDADSVEEKLSLADRFGLTVIFSRPDQEEYLAIVAGLCQSRRLAIDPLELRERAIRWALWGNGLSGRTARQFVDALDPGGKGTDL